MHLVGYLYDDYHDARSLEHKVCLSVSLLALLGSKSAQSNLRELL
jgi:hypothetical protein